MSNIDRIALIELIDDARINHPKSAIGPNGRWTKQHEIDIVRLKQCEIEASMSNCVKHSVGCIITDPMGVILSSGYNGTPAGHKNCCDEFPNFQEQLDHVDAAIAERSGEEGICEIKQLTLYDMKQARERLILKHRNWSISHEIHAEQNAIMKSDPIRRQRGTLYVNLQPCPNCAKMIAASGIGRVVYGKKYHRADDDVSKEIFAASNIEYVYYPGVLEM